MAIIALLCASSVWHFAKPGVDDVASSSVTPAGPSAAATPTNLVGATVDAAKVDQSTELLRPASGSAEALPTLAAATRAGMRSSNYRQYIQQVLAVPSASGIRVGLELSSVCSVIQQTKRQAQAPKLQLAPDLEAELQRRTQACEQGGGPDIQQFRALAAAKKRSFDTADEFLIFRVLKGTQEELDTLYRLGDSGGMASWGLASTPEHLALLVGDERVFVQQSSLAPVHAAWQAAVCERFGCDDFNARIVRCRDDASCQMSLQDILKESSGVDDATWQQLLAAARRRRDALLPG